MKPYLTSDFIKERKIYSVDEIKILLKKYEFLYLDKTKILIVKKFKNPIFIIYCNKDALKPAYGLEFYGSNVCIVRDDLPSVVKSFVEQHEIYHLTDKKYLNTPLLLREFKASFYPMLKHPIGFICTVVLSLADFSRINFYRKRIK